MTLNACRAVKVLLANLKHQHTYLRSSCDGWISTSCVPQVRCHYVSSMVFGHGASITNNFYFQHSMHTTKSNAILSNDNSSFFHPIKDPRLLMPCASNQQLQDSSAIRGRVKASCLYSTSFTSALAEHFTSLVNPLSKGRGICVRSSVSMENGIVPSSLMNHPLHRMEMPIGSRVSMENGIVSSSLINHPLLQRAMPIGSRVSMENGIVSSSLINHPLQQRAMSIGSRISIGSGSIASSSRKRLDGVKSFASGYQEAAALHLEAFWKKNYWLLVGAGGLVLCFFLWRIMFGVASVFVGFSEGMAEFGFFALAAALVIFSGLVLRARYSINPDAVYKIAMRKLNSTAGVLEVMGPPLLGTDVRAYIMSGGGFQLKKFRLRLSRKRCFLMFPLQGSERRALVSSEVIKNKGKYDFKLLALDLPTAEAGDQRLFVIGDENEYKVAGGLISELRDPIIKAMAAQTEFDIQDEMEAEAEAEAAKAKAEAEAEAEAAKVKAEGEARENALHN